MLVNGKAGPSTAEREGAGTWGLIALDRLLLHKIVLIRLDKFNMWPVALF